MDSNILDLRGLSCPMPVFETKKAIEKTSFSGIIIIVDTKTSVENIERLLSNYQNMEYTIDEKEDFRITIQKK